MIFLVTGQVIKHVSEWTKIPYTPLVCVFGLCLGAIKEVANIKVIE